MAEGGARAPFAPMKHQQQPTTSGGSGGSSTQSAAGPPLPPPLPAPLLTPLTNTPALRQLLLHRPEGHGFGFTLRHLIVYPPETYSELCSDVRHAMVGAVNEPMDSIFVRSVRPGGAGARAGLRPGDRLLAVDSLPVSGWPYAQVVQYIQQAPSTLALHVVPKEADVLQRYFSEAAYNPETNQRSGSRTRERRISGGSMPLVRDSVGALQPGPTQPLYTPSSQLHYRPINTNNVKQIPQPMSLEVQQRLMIEHRKPDPRQIPGMIAIPSMADPRTQHVVTAHNIRPDVSDRIYSSPENNSQGVIRAVEVRPQATRQQDLRGSRRGSEGTRSPLDNYPYCASPPSSPYNNSPRDSSTVYNNCGESLQNSYRNQLPFTKNVLMAHLSNQPANNKVLVQSSGNVDNVPVQYTNRFNLDDRRESNTSLTSSAADSKDSLSSYESNSTLTGHETDDSIILSRIRKSLEQKEEFLRRPSQPTGWVTPEDQNVIQQKEFYSRPQKLNKPVWPPSPSNEQSQSKNKENIQDNAISGVVTNNSVCSKECSDVCNSSSDKKECNSGKGKQDKCYISTLTKIHENSSSNDSSGGTVTNGSPASPSSLEIMLQDKRYPVPSEVQIVSNRTKQFESPQPEDRTELYKSELARLSTKKPEPTVALRRKEFESRGGKRDAKSLEAQYSLEDPVLSDSNVSGNRTTITGGKHLTCPPPEGFNPDNERVLVRLRSNSTGSEGLPTRRTHAADGSYVKRRFALSKEQMEELSNATKVNGSSVNNVESGESINNITSDNSNQIPNGFTKTIHKSASSKNIESKRKDVTYGSNNVEMVERLSNKVPSVKMEIDCNVKKPERPTQLNLSPGGFIFPHSPPTTPSSPHSLAPSPSGFSIDDGLVTKRQKNALQLGAEEERAMRRVSYLKATWGDRVHMDSDHELSDGETQNIRSEKKDRDEFRDVGVVISEDGETVNIAIQGSVQIKMVLTNGKRANDRSWKQVWAMLQGPKLLLYRHQHQSPTQGGSCESLNLRFSMADVAGDYTKRKHVVRVTSIAGTELLLQAGSAAEAARWLQALRAQTPGATQISEILHPIDIVSDASGVSPPSRNRKQTRTISPTENTSSSLTASPKSKTWKGRVARQLRKMQPGSGPLSGHSPTASPNNPSITPGVGSPLERCQGMTERPLVPHLVGICTRAVEERGLHVIGVYRVPGNTASVTALRESLEKGVPPDLQDARWTDVNVVSSLLKAFFRCLPNPLLTKELYPMFISADKLPDNVVRLRTIRRLVRGLPDHHYDTLKFLMEHLKKVVAESSINKMEARNLAIVFGPTLVRSADDNMLTMVNDMSSQCRIIESLINHMEWYFDEEDRTSPITESICEEELPSTNTNQALLIQNVKKIEGISTKDIVSSIISAANRKIQRKPRSKQSQVHIECSSPIHLKGDQVDKPLSPSAPEPIQQPNVTQPTSKPIMDDNYPIKTYTGLDQTTQERVKRFEMETRAVLRRDKRRDQSNDWQNHSRQETASPSLNSQSHISGSDSEDVTSKYYSKTNNNIDSNGKRLKTETNLSAESFSDGIIDMVSSLTSTFDQKLRSLHNSSPDENQSIPLVDESHNEDLDYGNPSLHRTSDILTSEELLKTSNDEDDDYKNESDCTHDEESLKLSSDRNSFENASIDKVERKLSTGSENSTPSLKLSITADENQSPNTNIQKEIPENNLHGDYYNNFSDGKHYDYQSNKTDGKRESKTTLQEIFFKKGSNVNNDQVDSLSLLIKSKLKRSESLNRDNEKYTSKNNNTIILSENNINSKNDASDSGIETEKSNSPKLRRSVSLNRSDVKLKRVESLTKNEKTESNLIKRREICHGNYKPTTKLKRKNGMPERSIKRRHTVGGTKDFDKDEWVALGCSRTSSPDLPTSLLDKQLHSQFTAQRLPLESHV